MMWPFTKPTEEVKAEAGRMDLIRQQFFFEGEGAGAFMAGKTRESCPYDRETQSIQWNHWIYGYDTAQGEKEIIKSGKVQFYATGEWSSEPVFELSVEEAAASGWWKPLYHVIGDDAA